MLAALARCERELDARNALASGWLALRFARLRELLLRGRLPRVAALGRRGAGKSSLLNAVEGREVAPVGAVRDTTREVSWQPIEWTGREAEWLDTPGLRAGGQPSRRDDVARALAMAPPDVVLLLCPASEVDAGIDADLEDAAVLVREVARASGRAPALFGVVTKVDELDPPDVGAPPFDDPDKRANIARSVRVFSAHLHRAKLAPLGVLPVSTYARFGRGMVHDDLRWNVGVLAARVAEALPSATELAGPRYCAELRTVLAGAFAEVTDVFAERARAAAEANGGGLREALFALNAAHVRVLRGLSPDAARAGRLGGMVDALARPSGPLELLRQGAAGLGARGASGAFAAARVRAAGAVLARAALGGVSDEALRALCAVPREIVKR